MVWQSTSALIEQMYSTGKCAKKSISPLCTIDRMNTIQEKGGGDRRKGMRFNMWKKTIILNGQQTTFKLDTGADATVIFTNLRAWHTHQTN